MRKALLAVALLVACSKSETPKTDTTAVAPAPPPPPAPAALKAADLAGTYTGESKPEGKDSVVGKWTTTQVNDSTSRLAFTGTKEAVTYHVKFDADSFVGTSEPYMDPSLPKKMGKVTFYTVGRKTAAGGVAGWAALHLVSKPDSVVGKVNWSGTKAP
jgi:hypothetical protein